MKNTRTFFLYYCVIIAYMLGCGAMNAIAEISDSTALLIEQHAVRIRNELKTNVIADLKKGAASTTIEKSLSLVCGGLSDALTPTEKTTITSLTITGTIDARDFKTMRDSLTALKIIDISSATIMAYAENTSPDDTKLVVYPADAMPEKAFYMDRKIIAIAMPVSLRTIGKEAFCGCTNLKSITIPASVTMLDDFVFFLSGLSTLEIPESVDSIGINSLCGEVIVANSNPKFSSLDGVLFNKNGTVLLFCPETKTGSYSIPPSVSRIESFSLNRCSKLTSVTTPETLREIGSYAFESCRGMTDINLPQSLQKIGMGAFQYCDSLKSIYIPSNVVNIGGFALACNASITVDPLNAAFSSEEGILFDKHKSKLIQCPTSKYGNYTIPSTVTIVGEYAFELCKLLVSISIPPSVSTIGGMGFYGCTNLTNLYVWSISPVDLTSSYAVFNGIDTVHCVLYVPVGSEPSYHVASQWSAFQSIQEFVVVTQSTNEKKSYFKPVVCKNSWFSFSEEFTGSQCSLFAPNGTLLRTLTIKNGMQLDFRKYAPGWYYIWIQPTKKQCVIEKFYFMH